MDVTKGPRRLSDFVATDGTPIEPGAPVWLPAVIGILVGGVRGLPPRPALDDCWCCGRPTWYDRDEVDWVAGLDADVDVVRLCSLCADQLAAEGLLGCVPLYQTD
jgi:hypothetical protein